jgi:hypothetical protein
MVNNIACTECEVQADYVSRHGEIFSNGRTTFAYPEAIHAEMGFSFVSNFLVTEQYYEFRVAPLLKELLCAGI